MNDFNILNLVIETLYYTLCCMFIKQNTKKIYIMELRSSKNCMLFLKFAYSLIILLFVVQTDVMLFPDLYIYIHLYVD